MKQELDNDKLQRIKELKHQTGMAMCECEKAIDYADERGDPELALAYLRAIGLALETPKMTFDERVLHFKDRFRRK